ncbi:uncharacterized protein ABDE67_018515 [Symphorus nematophorus]
MNTTFAENGLLFTEVLAIASASVNNILGVPLNGYVMWLILARETLASDFFSLNLAMSEIFFSLSSIWFFVSLPLRSFFCLEAFMFSCGLYFTARPLFQCCICVECYVGIVHPMLFLRFKPLRYRVACCCVAWLIVFASCLYYSYTFTNPLYLYGFFIQNVLFLTVMLFCCLSVLWALKRPGPGEKATEKQKSNKMKRRAFKIILLVMSSMTIAFFLYMAVIPFQCCLTEFANVFTICQSFALATGFIQPLLYLHRSGKLPFFKEL